MAGNKVVTFRTQFDGNEQTVPAVDNKGEVTITMPATAKPGEKFVLAAQAKDADNRTIGRAEKVITAIAPGIIQPEILSPGQSAYVLNDDMPVRLKEFACTILIWGAAWVSAIAMKSRRCPPNTPARFWSACKIGLTRS